MRVLAWDVGIKNLAFCLLESEPFRILQWDVLDLCPTGKTRKIEAEELRTRIIRALDDLEAKLFETGQIDCVLVENQPVLKNPSMKAVASCIFDYYLIRGKIDKQNVGLVSFTSPLNKLRLGILTPEEAAAAKMGSRYGTNKKLAVLSCEKLLREKDSGHLTRFRETKKKDDLADSLLLAFCKLPGP